MALSAASLVAAEEGNAAQARELAGAARQAAGDGNLGYAPQSSLAHAAIGAIHALEGRPEQARTEFDRALRSRLRWPGLSPWPTLETLLRLTPLLADIGDRPGAAALLGEAREHTDPAAGWRRDSTGPAGAVGAGDRDEAAGVGVTGGSAHRARGDGAAPAPGSLSLREIGQELHLSQNTIKTHTRAIYRKLDVSTRLGAVEKGHRAGVL